MGIYKIVAVGVVSALIIVYLKYINSELTMPVTICSGIILLLTTVSYSTEFIGVLNEITAISGIDTKVFSIIIKIVAISYLVEFSASLIDDFGLKSISDKVVFAGRLVILTMSMPIVKNLIEVIVDLI
ncbi:MAG: hypothetical protein IJ800_03755 [Clostridia bacterium]|nr:hypothetical protein [Clostridia bacterium]